jgi:acetyltransferase-like isoleucine patch superfamily enzyme
MLVTPDNITIGNHCYIGNWFYCNGFNGVNIGNNVLISHNVAIISANHDLSKSVSSDYIKTNAINIWDWVWIWYNVTILPGVNIWEWSIVGAMSVVTKDIPKNVVVVWNPARVINNKELC